MKNTLLAVAFVTSASVAACSWFSSGGSGQVLSGVGDVSACIIGQALSGTTDPTQISQACSNAAISDIEKIVASLINYFANGADAGPANAQLLARLQSLHDAAKAKLASGAK